MLEVPETSDLDIAFGNTDHLPSYKSIPEEFKDRGNKHYKFCSDWFFNGLVEFPKSKEGVDVGKALRAVAAILKSWEPKHEHKMAGAAYLVSQWFDIEDN